MFIENLKRAGHAVEAKGPVVQPFLSVPGQFVSIDGSDVQTFEYDSEKAAKAAVAKIAPDGSTVGDTRIGWVEPPHFFRKGRLLVLYVGKNEQVTRALKPVLGDQIAGK
jgi:membrane-associated protease RseP (regulator of RpoE activity)